MKIKDLKGICFSSLGGFIQFADLYKASDSKTPLIEGRTIEYIIDNYPEAEIVRIMGIDNKLLIAIKD